MSKLKHKFTPLIKTSFSLWLVCVLVFVGIIIYAIMIKNSTSEVISDVCVIVLAGSIVLGVVSFGIGLIAITYKVQGKSIKKNSIMLATIKVFFLLAILPIFLLWNIIQPVELFRIIKSKGVGQYWKEFKMKAFVLKTGVFFVAVVVIFPMWAGGYIGIVMIAEAKINIVEENINISGTGSMYPTFPKGDGKTNEERRKELVATPGSILYPTGFALMGKDFFSYEIGRGDIISFINTKTKEILERDNGTASGFLKRVIALPGDNIEIHDGLFYLNGEPQKEQYIARARSTFGGEFLEECKPLEIPIGKIFVMGDNRKGSGDSRSELGLIDYSDIKHVIPLEKQYGNLDKNWRDTANDLDESSIITLDVNKYVDLLNEKRKEAELKPLKYQPKLEKSAKLRGDAILKYNDFSFEGTKSGYDMKKAMQDVGYSNVTYGEAPTQGYYEAEELIENKFEFPDSKKFLLSKDYQEIGIAIVKGELNGCPTQIIVQHFAGYVPPNYGQSDINSWRDTLTSLKKNKPGWESLKKYDIYYKENKKNVDKINSIISTRIDNINRIISRMESNQWLTTEEQRLIDQDEALFDEQEQIANKLND
jgi:signal peptidase I